MNLNKFFKSLEYKNEIRNLLNDNRYNNDNLLFKSDTIKIDEIKKKYGYLNYTNSRKTFDIINKIKQKYINNNFVIDNSNKKFEILKNSINNNSNNNNNNKMFNTLQYDKQNNINFDNNNFSKTNKIKLSFEKLNLNNNNKFIFNEEDNNNINSDERELLNTENISKNKLKKFNNIFPISKRICLLCSLKQNIDNMTKDDSRIIKKNKNRNKKNKYYNNKYNYFIDLSSQNSSSSRINLGFNKINPNVSKSSIFDQVFSSRNKSNNENEISSIQSPILLNKNIKPKINVPNYNNFMYN